MESEIGERFDLRYRHSRSIARIRAYFRIEKWKSLPRVRASREIRISALAEGRQCVVGYRYVLLCFTPFSTAFTG